MGNRLRQWLRDANIQAYRKLATAPVGRADDYSGVLVVSFRVGIVLTTGTRGGILRKLKCHGRCDGTGTEIYERNLLR